MEELRFCKRCGRQKSTREFYVWRRGEIFQLDSSCKDCKKQRRARPSNEISPNETSTTTPRRESNPAGLIEPGITTSFRQSGDIDYGLWENLYSRTLSDFERTEIKFNLTEFFKVLISEGRNL